MRIILQRKSANVNKNILPFNMVRARKTIPCASSFVVPQSGTENLPKRMLTHSPVNILFGRFLGTASGLQSGAAEITKNAAPQATQKHPPLQSETPARTFTSPDPTSPLHPRAGAKKPSCWRTRSVSFAILDSSDAVLNTVLLTNRPWAPTRRTQSKGRRSQKT